jgi:hypothetical protein
MTPHFNISNKYRKVNPKGAMRNMKKGTNIWCLIVILAVVGSALSGMAGAANMSANLTDNAINATEEINNVTNVTVSNSNETVLDNASSINVSAEIIDDDEDGIDDYEEWAGHISKLDGKTYFTDNTSESTDRDPYDDGQEVDGHSPADLGDFGGQMPASVKAPGKHPLVPSYPDLKVELEGIEVIPKCKITSTKTKEEGENWMLETETTDRVKTGASAGISFSPIPPYVSIGASGSITHETTVRTLNSTSGWRKEEWSTATAVEPDKAAKLKFHLKIKNEGTDAAKDVKLTFNVKVGDKIVDTVWTGETPIAGLIGPGETYPAQDYIVIDSDKDGHEIVITLDELKSIELGAPISIDIVEIITEVPWGKTCKDWAPYISDIEEISARIMVDFGDGEVKDYRVFSGIRHTPSPPYPYIMNISVKESINWLIGLEEREDGVYIGTAPYVNKPVKLENWTFGFDNETFHQINKTLPENWTLYNLLNVTIKQGWVIVMKAPDTKPPEIHWASYSRDMKTIKASVSDNENIESVTAYVEVAGDYRKFNLTDEDHDLIFSITLPLVIQDIEDDYIEASDGNSTSKFDVILPPVDKSVNVTDLILEDNESYVIKDKTYKANNVTIQDNATLTITNATLHINASSDYQYDLSIEDNGTFILNNGHITTNPKFIMLTCINYSIYFGNISKYVNYTFYEKETVSTLITEKALSDYSKIENVQAYANCTLQKYTGFDISKAKNISTNITITQSYIQSYYKIKLDLSDNATFATKNDSQAVIYKISTTGQPEISISESVFENLTAIEGKADVLITKSYFGDLEKLSASSMDISDSEIKNIGDDSYNPGDPGENASISIDCIEDVYISNSTLLAEGGDGKNGYDGAAQTDGGAGGNGGSASISVESSASIYIFNSPFSNRGGNGSKGGDGGDDDWTVGDPGDGGNGGYGGVSLISTIGKSVSINNSSTSNAGGNAGNGGNGGDAGLVGADGDGGDGGDGGYASISIISDAQESFIKNSYLSSKGGNKGNGGWGHHYGDDGYLGDSSIPFTSKTLTILNSNLRSTDYKGDLKIAYMTFDCYTDLVNTTYTPFSATSGNRVNICYWLTTNVTDELEKPIESATVKVKEDPSDIEVKTDYTDKNGFSKMYLPSNITTTDSEHTTFVGNYFVHAFKNGYESDKKSISFTDNLQISLIITIPKPIPFDTGIPANPYPSIFGTHNGTIKPNQTITVQNLYTYPCPGTGGHTEYARIWNSIGFNATTMWEGYKDDWHNLSFDKTFTLVANETYNYTIRTGSYPQIHHTPALLTANGWMNCTQFTDANGKSYTNGIPAIRLE